MEFSNRLTELRKQSGLTQGDLAEQLNVSRQSVSKWETGDSLPDLPKLVQLADIFGVSLDALCGRDSTGKTDSKEDSQAARKSVQNIKRQKKRKILCGLLILIIFAAGMMGYNIGRSNGTNRPENKESKMIPKNLRVNDVQLSITEKYLHCWFCVNYYSKTASFSITLSDGKDEYQGMPSVEKDGRCEIWIPNEKLSVSTPMEISLTVEEKDGQRTITIAKEVLVTYLEGPSRWEVSFLSATDP